MNFGNGPGLGYDAHMSDEATTVDFIEIEAPNWEAGLCDRVAGLFDEGARVYVWAPSQAAAVRLDDLLWTWREETFVPHALWSGEAAFDEPVAVGWNPGNPNGAEVLVLAGDQPAEALLPCISAYPRVLDFIPKAEKTATEAARNRYRAFRDAGLTLNVVKKGS